MALYAVPNDIREALAPDGNKVGTAAELTDEQLMRAIQRGNDLVDATVGVHYTPESGAPTLVIGLVVALACFYATLMYRKGKPLEQFNPVLLQYNDARLTLTQIKQGLLDPTPKADTDQPPVRAVPSVFQPGTFMGSPQSVPMFILSDTGLGVVTPDDGSQPRITDDPALTGWGIY